MAVTTTLIDLAKARGNDSQIGIVEDLTHDNPILRLAPVKPIQGLMYKYQRRSFLPDVSFRGANQGVASSAGKTEQIIIETKIISGLSKVDTVVANAYPDGATAYRLDQDRAFVSSMGNTFNAAAYYGNQATNPLQFNGLANILNVKSGSSNGFNTCVSAGGSGANAQTSIYFWSFRPANVIGYGNLPGVQMPLGNGMLPTGEDLGTLLVNDADSLQYPAFVTSYLFQPGLAVYDTRAIGRLCNITSSAPPTATLINSIITQMHPYKPDLMTMSKATFSLMQNLKSTASSYFYIPNTMGNEDLFQRAQYFSGIPFMIDENIVDTEAVVS